MEVFNGGGDDDFWDFADNFSVDEEPPPLLGPAPLGFLQERLDISVRERLLHLDAGHEPGPRA